MQGIFNEHTLFLCAYRHCRGYLINILGDTTLVSSFFKRKSNPTPDANASLVHLLAEQIIRDANRRGAKAFRIKVYDKNEVLKHIDQTLLEIEEDAALTVQTRNRDMVVGLKISSDKDGILMMCIPAALLLPLINNFAGQTRERNNRRCFTVSGDKSSKDRYFEVKVIIENDSTFSIEFDEIP